MDKTQLVISSFIMISLFIITDAVIFKMTKAYCESYNKSWLTITQCRVKPKSRNVTHLNLETFIHQPVNEVLVKGALKKKENGYKPFLYSLDLDGCEFVRKHNNPIANLVYSLFKDFSTLNHSCPYVGKNGVKDFYLRSDLLKGLPLPSGDYLLLLTWIFHKKLTLVTNVYFVFEEDPSFNVRSG